jgi:hypothetical protein
LNKTMCSAYGGAAPAPIGSWRRTEFQLWPKKMDTCDRVTKTVGTMIFGLFADVRLAGGLFFLDHRDGARPANGAISSHIAGMIVARCAEHSP